MPIQTLKLHNVNDEMQQCIQNCLDCHSMCLNAITYCLAQGGHHSELSHIRLMMACVESCQTSANFMLRGSNFYAHFCGVCAEVCDRCAKDCANMGHAAQMQACAEMCRCCAETCRRMSMAMT